MCYRAKVRIFTGGDEQRDRMPVIMFIRAKHYHTFALIDCHLVYLQDCVRFFRRTSNHFAYP